MNECGKQWILLGISWVCISMGNVIMIGLLAYLFCVFCKSLFAMNVYLLSLAIIMEIVMVIHELFLSSNEMFYQGNDVNNLKKIL